MNQKDNRFYRQKESTYLTESLDEFSEECDNLDIATNTQLVGLISKYLGGLTKNIGDLTEKVEELERQVDYLKAKDE